MRKILAGNIKNFRKSLHISQAKLAEYADISLSYLTDIERCRTWVSDKTLLNLSKALNKEVWELFSPIDDISSGEAHERLKLITEIISKKRTTIHQSADKAIDDLVMEILQIM